MDVWYQQLSAWHQDCWAPKLAELKGVGLKPFVYLGFPENILEAMKGKRPVGFG